MEDYKGIQAYLRKHPHSLEAYEDWFELARANGDIDICRDILKGVTSVVGNPHTKIEEKYRGHDLMKRLNLMLAPKYFHHYCIYLEWNRDPKKRFYQPRMKALYPLAREMQRLEDDDLDLLCISLPPGVGKALADDTPILTRQGWKNHGDLVVGDEVIGLDGKFKKVTHVHPKCMLDRLVTFSNGEQIQCHENHEWMTWSRGRNRYITKETNYYESVNLEAGGTEHKRGHRYQFQLPPRHVEGEAKELFDPYTLGVWLGDGANNNPRITNELFDIAIIEKIRAHGYEEKQYYTTERQPNTVWYDFDFRKELQKYDMCHSTKRKDKHVPVEYLTASEEQRLELLAGLIDTDGTRCGSKYQFTTCDESLRDSVVELISTFGWRVCVRAVAPSTSSSGIVGKKTTYILSFTPDRFVPCALERKQLKEIHKPYRVSMVSIEKVEPKQGNCITVEGDGMYLAGRTMIPTHNTTLALFYLSWLGGKHPDMQMLESSHNVAFLRGCYDELLRICDPDGEYLYADVFPNSPVVETNAKDLRIDLQTPKRFQTFQLTSVGAGNAGKVRATKLLYCDDLVDGIETAVNPVQLDKLWNLYATDLRQRKQGDVCKELHIATRWSVNDVIGRLEMMYGTDPRAKFINVPALNGLGQSNFDYPYGLGFSTEMYKAQKEAMSELDWNAIYMGIPVERDALLFPREELQRFMELPTEEPDAVFAVCDTKDKGDDYFCMPIVYQYGERFFLADVVYDNRLPDVVIPRMARKLVEHGVKQCRFESNSAGGRIALEVDRLVKENGGFTNITTKYTTANKQTKILVNADFAKNYILYKDDSACDREYLAFLNGLCSYTHVGKNLHDDAPDAMAMFADYIQSGVGNRIEIRKRPF